MITIFVFALMLVIAILITRRAFDQSLFERDHGNFNFFLKVFPVPFTLYMILLIALDHFAPGSGPWVCGGLVLAVFLTIVGVKGIHLSDNYENVWGGLAYASLPLYFGGCCVALLISIIAKWMT